MKNTTANTAGSSTSDASRAPLFRAQVIATVGSRQYGTVIIKGARVHGVLAGIAAVLFLAVMTFFAFFGTTRKAQSGGILLPSSGVIRIVAGQSGTIVQARVREGQKVKRGDVLFVLSSERGYKDGLSAESVPVISIFGTSKP